MAAGVPSLTYLLQNLCIQAAYQKLDGLVFNILNQTKMLFTALFVYLILGRRQSPVPASLFIMANICHTSSFLGKSPYCLLGCSKGCGVISRRFSRSFGE
ncbi:unnamed protein product [Symbiodinium pilosum]|uniref:Uncharacterized protein n=1 Tax=Symbiodinium pilosum TaxID=2952 RepID=A0A812YK06_SYMPI|nr:unnamed protein product [Symbiodinium pilosum]